MVAAGALKGVATPLNDQSILDAKSLKHAKPQYLIHNALAQERARTFSLIDSEQGLRQSLHSGLSQTQRDDLAIPDEVNGAAAALLQAGPLTGDQLDKATQKLNSMIEKYREALDSKVLECRTAGSLTEKFLSEGRARVQTLSSKLMYNRAAIMMAAGSLPLDKEWRQTLATAMEFQAFQCANDTQNLQKKVDGLEQDVVSMQSLQQDIAKKCGSSQSARFLQAEPCPESTNSQKLNLLMLRDARAGGEPLRQTMALLQNYRPTRCRTPTDECSHMLDTMSEVVGQLQDTLLRVRSTLAARMSACQSDDKFSHSELMHASHSKRTNSLRLADEFSHQAGIQHRTEQASAEVDKLQAQVRTEKDQCEKEKHDLLYNKICHLQQIRDRMNLLAGKKQLPQDCEVTEWEEGACSLSCGGGKQNITRSIVLPAVGGAKCPSLGFERACNEEACPVHCVVSEWGGWSSCSAECDNGIQERARSVKVKNANGGDVCPQLLDVRFCNGPPCNTDCQLSDWTDWADCTQACDRGTQWRKRGVKTQESGSGSCPAPGSQDRLEGKDCNAVACTTSTNITCDGAPVSVVILMDNSGSLHQHGYNAFAALAKTLISKYSPTEGKRRVGIADFGGTSRVISELTYESSELESAYQKFFGHLPQGTKSGPTKLGNGLMTAKRMLTTLGRPKSVWTVVVLTDGRVSDPYLAKQAAIRVKSRGIRLVFVRPGFSTRKASLLSELASIPARENVIQVAGLKRLEKNVDSAASKIVLGTCSSVKIGSA